MTTLEFQALGTSWWIDTEQPLHDHTAASVHTRVAEFDQTYSRFRADSLVSQVNRTAGQYRFPTDAGPLFQFYRQLYDATTGAVTPLVGRALEHLGYDPDYTLQRRPGKETVPRWDDVLHVDGHTITVTQPLLLDLGAAGKGHLVDNIAAILRADGISGFLVDASGDLRHSGTRPCQIALEHPTDPTQAIGTVALSNNAVAASTSQRRRWGPDLHHIIDPTTSEPTTDIVAAWAIAGTTMTADGLSTALFFTPPHQLAQHFNFQWVRALRNGTIQHSANFTGNLFS